MWPYAFTIASVYCLPRTVSPKCGTVCSLVWAICRSRSRNRSPSVVQLRCLPCLCVARFDIIRGGGVYHEDQKNGAGRIHPVFPAVVLGGKGSSRDARSHGHELRLLCRSSAVCTGKGKRGQGGRSL